ncbi:MAG: hypothetical protein JNG83_13970 [Opitutaceae bacterium]|nr:hypothetical protein [Opitutaceae bacterium]
MKTKIIALALVAATAVSLTPKPALAGDKEWAAVGGFVGGLIVGSVLSDGRHDGYGDRHTTVVVNHSRPSGYWKEVSVRVWVPGYHVEERGRHGRIYRRYIPGHYECRTDRVWVSYGRDHRDREIGYGYGHRR